MNDDHSQLDKADMFALGATMYQLATGADLPEGKSFQFPFHFYRRTSISGIKKSTDNLPA
jgi:hypothetical protein